MLALRGSRHAITVVVLFINVFYFIENYFTSVSDLAFRPKKTTASCAKIEIATPAALEQTAERLLFCKCIIEEKQEKQRRVIVVLTSVYAGLSFESECTNSYAHTFSSTKFSANGPLKP